MGRKKLRNFKHKPESGQALIEFVLGLMIVISVFFFYVKLAANFAVGNFIHYATFMAARAYSASAVSPEAQTQNAEAVLQSWLVGRWRSLIKPNSEASGAVPGATVGPGPYFSEDPLKDNWNQGVTYSFQTQLAFYPWSRGNQAIKLDLVSESWMRREDSEVEARQKRDQIQASNRVPGVRVEWDNGW